MVKNIVIVIALFMATIASGHNFKGIVTAANDGVPLEGVSVYNKTTGAYVYTEVSGKFELGDVSLGDTVIFYHIGYENFKLVINNSNINVTVPIALKIANASLDQVLISSKSNVLSNLVNVDLKTDPVKSSQELLRKIPGLVIGQHAGGGKAEQIFLRGFDIDHGTDIAINVDGLPVNMVSHAHGQGYADLHFIIPETIDNIDFGKGAYYADKGNFNTAGYVDFKTKTTLKENVVSLEAGQFNTVRALSMLKLLTSKKSNAYVASTLNLTDGVFESPQNFNRFNIMGRYNFNNYKDQELSVTLSHFQSKWEASGQIPERAVSQGLINRFGAIDDTEGGNTSRSNIWVNHKKQIDANSNLTTAAYISKYDFELFSNFTFFLEDPVNGDQIRQFEDRTLIGAHTTYKHTLHIDDHNARLNYKLGAGFRYDDVNDVQLSRTLNRRTLLERLAFGDIDETNAFAFADLSYRKNNWTINPSLRLDYFTFDYVDFLSETFDSRSENESLLSPKLNFTYAASPQTQFYLKTGLGFHSNDTRVVTANTGEDTLPRAFSADLGTVLKPTTKLAINAAIWSLFLEQEFVYVGDAAIVEPSGETQRLGVDFGVRYQITNWLHLNTDINYTYARSIDAPNGEDFIPLAPDLTSTGGITIKNFKRFSGGLNYRYIKDRPANEDNSIVAEGYFVTDFNLNYNYNKWTIGLIIENLLDTDWNETQFATESRLFNEENPVEEIHFTPGTPFFLRAKIAVRF
jgi:hypothetical protein